jgi:HAD superfamily hydrolase (TIGR01548 family)
VDLAYVDFAVEDITRGVLSIPNAVLTRTLSKAWGLAGLRVGWAAGPRQIIDWLRAAGQPYSVSAPSLILAEERIRTGREDMARFTTNVRKQRGPLIELLGELGAPSTPSEGNYVFPRHAKAAWIRDALAGLGIAVRAFPGKKYLEDGLRITIPGDDAAFERLCHGLRSALAPEALFFDMDDTLADVTGSYRGAIIDTAKTFGVTVTLNDITAAKAEGDANNDWVLTRKLINQNGVEASLEEVTKRFEELYQGTQDKPGLKATETLLVPKDVLERLAGRIKLGVVTGRPMRDALDFLKAQGIEHLFSVLATMEDKPPKPNPAPVRAALARLGITRAWMIGDTPDDIRAARAASVIPIGVVAPADKPEVARPALIRSGAGRVIENIAELEELLP